MPPKSTAQRPPSIPVISTLNLASALADSPDLDPSLLALTATASSTAPAPASDTPIDPTLFTIQQVVNDVRRGHVDPDELDEQDREQLSALPVQEHDDHQEQLHGHVEPIHDHSQDVQVQVPVDAEHSHIQLDDDGIDPALREIVNSLTNAQQVGLLSTLPVSHQSHSGFSENPDERERLDRERLQQTLQTTLEDFAQQSGFGSYSAIFNTNFPETGSGRFGIPQLPEVPAEGAPVKRGRGRPKGSKNKPKPNAVAPPPPPAKRPRGRPPKIRSNEEVEEMERRKQEKELGINRKRGRPRKYPEIGLVRELRLKKNRGYFAEKIAQLEERDASGSDGGGMSASERNENGTETNVAAAAAALAAASEVSLGHQVAAAVARGTDDSAEHYSWDYQDGQTLLDVVGMGSSMDVDNRHGMDGVELPDASGVDDGMGVFSLANVTGQQ